MIWKSGIGLLQLKVQAFRYAAPRSWNKLKKELPAGHFGVI